MSGTSAGARRLWTRAVLAVAGMCGALAAGGAVAATGVVHAAYTDGTRLEADLSSGFALAVLDADGTIAAVADRPGEPLRFASTTQLLPGGVVRIPLELAANGTLGTAPRITVRAAGEGPAAELTGLLSATVVEHDPDGDHPLVVDAPLDAAVVADGAVIAPREGVPQPVGEVFTGGDAARLRCTVIVRLADDPALRELDAASWRLDLTIEGTSLA